MGRSFSFPLPALRLAARTRLDHQIFRRYLQYAPAGMQHGIFFYPLPFIVTALNDTDQTIARRRRPAIAPQAELCVMTRVFNGNKRIAHAAQQRHRNDHSQRKLKVHRCAPALTSSAAYRSPR